MAESSLPFLLTLEQHRVNDTSFLACSEASSANDNNSWCSRVREVFRVVRAVDTIDGQSFIDLIFKVESEDGLRASIYQTSTGVRTPSTKWNREVEHQAMPQIPSKKFFPLGEYEIPSPVTLVTTAKL